MRDVAHIMDGDYAMSSSIPRRVYRRELQSALGYSSTWFREQQKRGLIPKGHTDPGGKREWWPEAEARAIVESVNRSAA